MADCKHTLPPGSHTFVCTVTPPPYACSFCEMERLNADNGELRQALEMATGPHCSSCGNPIDPDVCHCGDYEKGHGNSYETGHGFVPMGCICGYADPDWKALALARGEMMWKQRAELTKLLGQSGPTVDELAAEIEMLRAACAKWQEAFCGLPHDAQQALRDTRERLLATRSALSEACDIADAFGGYIAVSNPYARVRERFDRIAALRKLVDEDIANG